MSDHVAKVLPPVDLSVPPAAGLVRVTFLPEGKTVEFPFGSMPYEGHGQPMSFLDVAENYGQSFSIMRAAASARAPRATCGLSKVPRA